MRISEIHEGQRVNTPYGLGKVIHKDCQFYGQSLLPYPIKVKMEDKTFEGLDCIFKPEEISLPR